MEHEFEIGSTYRDTGSYRQDEDQFLRWIRGPLSSGIKNTGGIRELGASAGDRPAALVLVSNDNSVSQHEDPWEDTLEVNAGRISYWGDAKASNPYDDSDKNDKIRQAFDSAAARARHEVPPVLVFQKPRSGVVRFCGLCVPDYYEVRSYVDNSGNRIPNYLFHFRILNAGAVPVSWLHDRARELGESDAPPEWTQWVNSGTARTWPLGEQLEETAGRTVERTRTTTEVSEAFRVDTLTRYEHRCVMTSIGEDRVLDVAHILPRVEYPELAEHPENVLVLNALHHRAFDAQLFTFDDDLRLMVDPEFEPGHPFLQGSILDQAGEALTVPSEVSIDRSYFEQLNAEIPWA
jgi:hypothetical protein